MDNENYASNTITDTEVVIIGGGLAGIFSAINLSNQGIPHILIDNPLPDAKSRLGGFARFSGAKFSLPPAGMGLVHVAGSEIRLSEAIEKILKILSLEQKNTALSSDNFVELSSNATLRKYSSIVLSPTEIDILLDKLDHKVRSSTRIIAGKATHIVKSKEGWSVRIDNGQEIEKTITCSTVFYAAGRLSNNIIAAAGALPTTGKGLDIGVRVEFLSKDGVSGLRSYGPDAKILNGNCRTFCLNSPGTIYRYDYLSGSIPGGVVADDTINTANVGILCRTSDKDLILQNFRNTAYLSHKDLLLESDIVRKSEQEFTIPSIMRNLFGDKIVNELEQFGRMLDSCKLWDTRMDHKIHLPLLDWHWSTFALPESHKTTEPGLYALGDSSGHARGLLQAAISGWFAAEEYGDVR
ncbi:FAD-dependent monooxygenase [Pseudomonas atacamensis]|uniref:FAD-dependent monooxygenase n=1 Tax=Pseudomonas atacamensis TaxID=2565368 RepID=UPI0030D10574